MRVIKHVPMFYIILIIIIMGYIIKGLRRTFGKSLNSIESRSTAHIRGRVRLDGDLVLCEGQKVADDTMTRRRQVAVRNGQLDGLWPGYAANVQHHEGAFLPGDVDARRRDGDELKVYEVGPGFYCGWR